MFAALTKSSLRTTTPFQQNFTRSFHASSANMAIKTYFECQWTGPQLTCDMSGKVTSKDDSVARKSPRHSP
jgi:peptidylprolyl isomerase